MEADPDTYLKLEGRMEDWGPFGKKEGDWLIMTVGNPLEGHGYALPRSIDNLVAQYVGLNIALKTGSRYVAHIPYTTDHAGDVAQDWAPKYIPIKQFIEKTTQFLNYHIETYRTMGLKASKLFIYSGHGGNDPLKEYQEDLKEELGLDKLIIGTGGILEQHVNEVMIATRQLAIQLSESKEEQKKLGNKFVQILLGAGHAGHMEHSMAYALDLMDEEKLEKMNAQLEKDFEATLKEFPPLGGLGGYLLAGSKYEEALGTKKNDKYNLWKCLKTLKRLDAGKVKPYKELGKMVIDMIIDLYSKILLEN
ncbi:MAG: hypothetical protein BAJALOKI1v1_660021 [Promethearchaeota archaeon]|nr:MAG: hypothetical protein BAJALOKI1v1_660021 [Candidatus Lokiarchaeota archaeon]